MQSIRPALPNATTQPMVSRPLAKTTTDGRNVLPDNRPAQSRPSGLTPLASDELTFGCKLCPDKGAAGKTRKKAEKGKTQGGEDAHDKRYDYENDQMQDIWLSNSKRHEPRWLKANDDADRLLAYVRSKGLDPQETAFMISSGVKMLKVAARGLPNMPRDWIHGMQLYDLVQNETEGLGHIYELVLNTKPAVAYLLNTNTPLATRLVIAHVFAHTDFFKRNRFFKDTRPEEILHIVGGHREKMKKLVNDLSIPRNPETRRNPVREFVDKVHSIENLIDHDAEKHPLDDFNNVDYIPPIHPTVKGGNDSFRNIDLNDRYLYSDAEWNKKLEEAKKQSVAVKLKFPVGIDRDLLGFLAKHSPVAERWKRQILQMKREQAYYFLAMRQTQIMNEGWASFWHTKTLLEDPKTTLDQIHELAKLNEGVLSGKNPMNPYFLGFNMWQDLYIKAGMGLPLTESTPAKYRKMDIDSIQRQPNFDEKKALKVLMDIVAKDRDYTFVEKYMTPSLVEKLKLYKIEEPEGEKLYSNYKEFAAEKEKAYEQVHEAMLKALYYNGLPVLEVVDGDFQDNGELLINHSYTTDELNVEDTKKTLQVIAHIWGRPVHLDTYLRKDKKNPKSELTAVRYTADPKANEIKTFLRKGRIVEREVKINGDGKVT